MIYETTITSENEDVAVDLLAGLSRQSKTKIKHAMRCGAVWIRRPGVKERRLRRASHHLRKGDTISLYYDAAILGRLAPKASCVRDLKRYSIWFKPAGMMTQGTRYGDHCALLRMVELHFKPPRRSFAVHRIDREASGLVIVAHDREAAARFSLMLRQRRIDKVYHIKVRGDLSQNDSNGEINIPLDKKPAITRYQMLGYDPQTNQSRVRVAIITGRRHQIRRHFEMIGFPVMGDPRYGKGNKNAQGLQLEATGLGFECPFNGGPMKIQLNLKM